MVGYCADRYDNGCAERCYGCETHRIKKWFGSRIHKTAISHGWGKDDLFRRVPGERKYDNRNEVGETIGESGFTSALSYYFNQLKRIDYEEFCKVEHFFSAHRGFLRSCLHGVRFGSLYAVELSGWRVGICFRYTADVFGAWCA